MQNVASLPNPSFLRSIETRYKLRACAAVGCAARVSGTLWIHGDGEIRVGNSVFFDAERAPIELYARAGATITVGDNSYIGGGSSIEATESIVLGARSRVGAFCKVMDNHFHPLVGDRNILPAPHPVVIEDDVTIGPRSIVLAGARLARGSRIDAGSVVRRAPSSSRSRAPTAATKHDSGSFRTTPLVDQDVTFSYVAREVLRVARLLVMDRRAGLERTRRGIGVVRARILFRNAECGLLVNALGYVRVITDGKLRLGDRVQLSAGMFPTELICRAGAELTVGARTLLSYGVSVDASERVQIGERCMFGSMVRIRDANESGNAPVIIGDDVWVAHGAIVEPGVTIGNGSVVAAGSVVCTDVPPHSLAVGNPAVSRPLRLSTPA